ncbi:formin-like protein 6 [Zingiber officinale]|uniref:formin-like protein 6 n=1 Tax=Zingiber officinale TaxID=94328 RepID=UPI001C4D7803|nr:formin-like protein 6 [Zingiber officinale]
MRLLSEELLSYFRLSYLTPETPHSLAEVLTHSSEVQPLPISDMEIMRRGRVILERRSLPYSSLTSVGVASPANPRPRLPRRVSSTVQHASFPRPTHPRSAPSSRTTAPVRPRAPPTAQPFTPTPLQSIDPFRPTSSPGRGRGRRSANAPNVSPAFREASQAARRARSRLRRRAPNPSQDSGPSAVPPPPPPVTTPTPAPGQADASPAPPEVQVESPLAQPSTSQQHQSTEAGPSHCSSPATSPPEPSRVPPAAPSESAVGPSQPPPPVPLYYRTTAHSEVELQSRQDVSTSSLIMKGRLATLWEESMHQMKLLLPPAQMDRFSELYIKACAESLMINQSFQDVHHQNKMLRDIVTELELQLKDPA